MDRQNMSYHSLSLAFNFIFDKFVLSVSDHGSMQSMNDDMDHVLSAVHKSKHNIVLINDKISAANSVKTCSIAQ